MRGTNDGLLWTSAASTTDLCSADVRVNGMVAWRCERSWGHEGACASRERGGMLSWTAPTLRVLRPGVDRG